MYQFGTKMQHILHFYVYKPIHYCITELRHIGERTAFTCTHIRQGFAHHTHSPVTVVVVVGVVVVVDSGVNDGVCVVVVVAVLVVVGVLLLVPTVVVVDAIVDEVGANDNGRKTHKLTHSALSQRLIK